MVEFYNRVKFTAVSAGTGDFVVGAAVTGYRTPAQASVGDGDIVRYVATNATETEWEIGTGTYAVGTTTLDRTTVLENHLGTTALINFSTAPIVWFDVIAQDLLFLNDADYGDITVSSSGTVMAIDNDAVTYAKIQNVSAASKLLGRGDSGAGNVEEITLGSGLSMSGTTVSASGATPGGSDTQVQFNDSSAFGGDAGLTYVKATDMLVVAGPLRAAGGTDVFGGFFTVNFGGPVHIQGSSAGFEIADRSAGTGSGWQHYAQGGLFRIYNRAGGADQLILTAAGALSITGLVNDGVDCLMWRDAAGILAHRNGTNAQAVRIYNTFTDASNYERINVKWASNIAHLDSEAAGSGTRRPLIVNTFATTVGALPAASAALQGARLMVTDANAATFGTTAAAGGANIVPVWCDGTVWKIG